MKKENILKRIKLDEMEKKFLVQLLSMFYENKDDMYYEIDSDLEARKAFENLSMACGYSNKPEMNKKTVKNCLKILGS